MPFRVIEFQSTPNPNAVKCVLDASPAPDGPRSYSSADAARGDPVGRPLMAVPGVVHVLIHDGWVSVVKSAGAEWRTVRKGIAAALESCP